MKLIDVGKIKVTPFEFDSILEIKIIKELNEHSVLYVCGIVRDDKQFTPVSDNTEEVKVKCENDGKVYFSGVLQSVKVTCVNAIYRLEACAISNTILLDTVKHKRSFQDNSQTYQSIVETVIADNSGSVTYNADALTVENIILQYNETDWEFAKRLASHTNDVLIPIIDDSPAFHFGAPTSGGASLESVDYSISRNFYSIRNFDRPSSIEESKEGKPLKMTADDVTVFCVETDDYLCDIGEKFSLNGNDLHVCHLSLTFENSALVVVYTLCPKKAVSTPKFYNPSITGLIIDGKVTEVENDTLKLKLDDNKARGVEQDTSEAHFFKYSTNYSMEKNTGWYVMPEENDIVQLLFPIEDEKFAYATSSLRQEDTARTMDYMVKYLRTSYGRLIKMDKDEILISTVSDDNCDDCETYVRLHKDKDPGIEIITPNRILIKSDGSTINIESEDDMTIKTKSKMFIEASDKIQMMCGNSSIIMEPGEINVKSPIIKEN